MGGLTLDNRQTLPVVSTYDRGRLGKIDRFRSMCCRLGGLMGPPVVPNV